MAFNFSSPIDNGDYGSGLLRASVKISTAWSTASAEDILGTGKSRGNNSTVLIIISACVAGTYTL